MPVKLKSRPNIKDKLGKWGKALKVSSGYYLWHDTRKSLRDLSKRLCKSLGEIVLQLMAFESRVPTHDFQSPRLAGRPTSRKMTCLTMLASEHRELSQRAAAAGVTREKFIDTLVVKFGSVL